MEKNIEARSYINAVFYTTLRGERVRSKSEQDIADRLYHNLKYEYEPKVNFEDGNFRPDFYMPQANLYLEHVSNKSYKTVNKEERFVLAGRSCVKTFEALA